MINRLVLVGRLTKDPELRYTSSNIAVVSFTLAVDRGFTKNDGTKETDFIQCVAWRKTAENVGKYVRKGSLVGVDGRLQTRTYEAKDGSKRYVTEAVCDTVKFLESRNQETTSEPQSVGSGNVTSEDNKFNPFKNIEDTTVEVTDDDLPF